MRPHKSPVVSLLLCVLLAVPVAAFAAGGDVLMYHNDITASGAYLTEPLLSATNVNATTFGMVFKYTIDASAYAQPLYKSGVSITTGSYSGTTHNVVFVATENDSLYAFDADDAAGSNPLWDTSFLTGANVTPVLSGSVNSSNISPIIGITSTPVIDATTNTIFTVAKTMEIVSGSGRIRLQAARHQHEQRPGAKRQPHSHREHHPRKLGDDFHRRPVRTRDGRRLRERNG